jgi:hypothetical protein
MAAACDLCASAGALCCAQRRRRAADTATTTAADITTMRTAAIAVTPPITAIAAIAANLAANLAAAALAARKATCRQEQARCQLQASARQARRIGEEGQTPAGQWKKCHGKVNRHPRRRRCHRCRLRGREINCEGADPSVPSEQREDGAKSQGVGRVERGGIAGVHGLSQCARTRPPQARSEESENITEENHCSAALGNCGTATAGRRSGRGMSGEGRAAAACSPAGIAGNGITRAGITHLEARHDERRRQRQHHHPPLPRKC